MSSGLAGRHDRPRLDASSTRMPRGRRGEPSRAPRRYGRRPALEGLEARTLLSVTASGYNAALGAVTLTGNAAGSYLVLSETPSPDLSGHPEVLMHNLPYSAGTPGALNSVYDFDPSTPGDQELTIGQGTAPMITVDFTAGGTNTLQLDTSWTFTHPITMTGGSGQDTLINSASGTHGWTLTGANSGTIGSNLTFSGVDVIQADSANDDSLQGQDTVAATWSFAAGSAATYGVGSPTISFQGFKRVQSGSGNNTFLFSGDGSVGTFDIQAGAGNDAFYFADFSQLDGSIDGGDGANTLAYYNSGSSQGYSSSINLAISGVSPTVGYSGLDYTGASLTGTFSNITSLIGNASSNQGAQLTGSDADSTWTLAGSSAISYKDATNVANPSLSISGFSDLVGGAGNDTYDITANTTANIWETAGANAFNFSDGAVLDGMVGGGSGADSLNLSAYTTALAVVLTGSDSTGLAGSMDPITGGFFGIDSLTAGSNTGDQLTGEDVASSWTLGASSASYADGTATLAFSGFEALQGGSAVDTFDINANTSANLAGGGGLDVFSIADGVTASGSIDGQAGSAQLDLSGYATNVHVTLSGSDANGFSGSGTGTAGFQGINSVVAGSGSTNRLTGENAASTWTVNGSSSSYSDGSHSLSLGTFNVFEGGSAADTFNVNGDTTATLAGGAGANSFVFDDAVVLTGSISGTGGTNTLDLGAYSTAISVALDAGAASGVGGTTAGSVNPITGRFDDIGDLTVGASGSSLVGENAARVWNLDSAQTYGDGTNAFLTFSGFGSLTGGSAADTFNIKVDTTANLNGGAGANQYNVSAGKSLTGSITGGSGADSLNLSAYTTALAVVLTGSDATGLIGTVAPISGGFFGIDSLAAGSNTGDQLTGEDAASTWTLGASSASYADGTATLAFSGFEALQGGSAVDTFHINANTSVNLAGGGGLDVFAIADGVTASGSIDGQAGSAQLDLSGYTSNVHITLSGSNANGFSGSGTGTAGFQGINSVVAGSGSTNRLTGENAASTWTVNGSSSSYSDGSHSLSLGTFNVFEGGSAADTFNVNGSTTANLLGGAGDDAFVLSDGAVLSGSIDGSGGSNTLNLGAYSTAASVALDAGAASGVGGTTAGSVNPITGRFDSIGTLAANGASSTLVGENAVRVWDLGSTTTYGDGTDIFLTFSGFGTLTGGSDVDAFNIASNTTANLNGGGGGDTFDFQTDGVVLTGKIDGGTGSAASLIYSGYTSAHPVTLNLATGFATGTNGAKNIGYLFGADAATTSLIGSGSSNQWTIDGQDGGNLLSGGKTVFFSNVGNLTGGIGDDSFFLTEGGTLSGTIVGGIGSNSIQVGSLSNAVTMSITGANAGNILESTSGSLWNFSGISNLTGTGLGDTFKFSRGASIDGAINGQGSGTLDYSAYTTSVRVDLGLGYATGVKGGLNGAITGIANVTGGSGNDILIGNASANALNGGPSGNDILVGRDGDDVLTVTGSGRNILIGGNGADTLQATTTTGDNLLIGGRVVFSGSETNTSALNSLMTEWSRAGVNFDTRTKHLTGQMSGGLNGQYKLVLSGTGQTVFNDAAIDSLYGSQNGPGHTWFVAFYQDSTHKANIFNSRTGDRTDTSGSGTIS